MNGHLAEISRQVAPGARAVLILDGAGWHQTGGRLRVPDNISLAPYSPELNPVENVWHFLRQDHPGNRVYETHDAIVDACCNAWNALPAEPDLTASIATRRCLKPLVQITLRNPGMRRATKPTSRKLRVTPAMLASTNLTPAGAGQPCSARVTATSTGACST